MQRTLLRLSITLLSLLSFSSFADHAFVQRKDVKQFIHEMVQQYHFNQKELNQIMGQVTVQPQLIESMDKPYEQKNWDVYRAIFLTPKRLEGGLNYWATHRASLEKAQKQYGVPAEIIVAILGVETLYGERQGDNKVLDALATLAFNYPKRSVFFTNELKEFLLLSREQGVPAIQYKGSYAGAIGKPQFMPSSYRRYAVDFNNKGHQDLVHNDDDSIASIANYLHQHAWNPHEGIAQNALLSKWRLRRIQMNPKKANYSYDRLIAAGVKPAASSPQHPSSAGLIELITAEGKEYWLAYPNFFVITRYNSSPQYALVVHLLAQQLKQHWLALNNQKHVYA